MSSVPAVLTGHLPCVLGFVLLTVCPPATRPDYIALHVDQSQHAVNNHLLARSDGMLRAELSGYRMFPNGGTASVIAASFAFVDRKVRMVELEKRLVKIQRRYLLQTHIRSNKTYNHKVRYVVESILISKYCSHGVH